MGVKAMATQEFSLGGVREGWGTGVMVWAGLAVAEAGSRVGVGMGAGVRAQAASRRAASSRGRMCLVGRERAGMAWLLE